MEKVGTEINFTELLDKINPASKEDIVELQGKIKAFRSEEIDSEKFRAYRLARGVYGQRQEGVQMIRIKLPYGKITPDQLIRIADISDKYASSNLHLTTRQDIQIHFVKLENSPKVWADLEEVGVTLREACGNTVRNITASCTAGIDPKEPFDVTPYTHAHFEYFLRNPICQEMGRKFKMSFSSSEEDTAFGFIHDLGFIPRIQDGKRGFKVLIAGGLGAQPFMAFTAYEFLAENQIIPFTEAVIRVFDRYGERSKRNKARLKYLVHGIGLEAFMKLVEEERKGIKTQSFEYTPVEEIVPAHKSSLLVEKPIHPAKYERWKKTNVFEQKQAGFFGVYVKQHLGDLASDNARAFAQVVKKFASEDIRITVNQGWLLKFVEEQELPALFNALDALALAEPGFDSMADITACPGTDTCNLGISSSTGLSAAIEKMLTEEFPDTVFNRNIKIKISGCMNACGQHTIGNIGFHGMSIKNGAHVLPAMQVMLGGGLEPDGTGSIADKVIKLPSKRCVEAVRVILSDYEQHGQEGEYFNAYFRRRTAEDKMYFYKLLKPLAEVSTLDASDYIDWGHQDAYVTEVGVGECAGVMLDLVGTLISETEDKLAWTERLLARNSTADAAYAAYTTMVCGAKALLTGEGVNCNTQIGIIRDFDEKLVKTGKVQIEGGSFESLVLQINKQEPSVAFSEAFVAQARHFVGKIKEYRKQQVLIS
ncbi:MAG: nitrite/sulfite reductase [Cytophagaceae bacterium]|jgi:sulfite reductase (ferredoxin)|nr:nitrite/sulfite reductase [Cytophagaceae bacterium]